MAKHSLIESRQNPKFKQWLKFTTHPEREDCPWLAVEGWKQVGELAERNRIELLFYSDPSDSRLDGLLARSREAAQLAPRLLKSLSTVESPQGAIAFFGKPPWTWKNVTPYILYLYKLQDPGNLGTLLRTARATGIFSLVAGPGTVSCFNAKVVRASAAALFSVPFLEAIEMEELSRRGYKIWSAQTREGISLFRARFKPPLAVLIGSEGAGLDPEVAEKADEKVHIPMEGESESLNAAVAGSLILYEIVRQQKQYG